MNRRGFFGWMAAAVAAAMGTRWKAECREPMIRWSVNTDGHEWYALCERIPAGSNEADARAIYFCGAKVTVEEVEGAVRRSVRPIGCVTLGGRTLDKVCLIVMKPSECMVTNVRTVGGHGTGQQLGILNAVRKTI